MRNTELKTIALISSEPIRQIMAGIGIRYIGMANALTNRGFNVCLYSPSAGVNDVQKCDLKCQYKVYDESSIASELDRYDFVVAQGRCAAQISGLNAGIQLIIDLYDPYIIENLSYANKSSDAIYRNDHSEWVKMLRRGDYFLCANNHQKLFYLGWLMALDRLNPNAYENDKYYSYLVDVVPFGVTLPTQKYQSLLENKDRSICRILFGGIYDWYDPWTLLEAIKDEPNYQVIFVRNPNVDTTPQKIFHEIEKFCKKSSMSDSQIKIIDWVPYERRFDLLHDVDMLIAPHEQGLESELSLRTRFIEALAVGCPVICTEGGGVAGLVNKHGGGRVVAEKNKQQLKVAIESIYNHKLDGKNWSDSSKIISSLYSWEKVLQPLIEHCNKKNGAVNTVVNNEGRDDHLLETSSGGCRYSIVLPTYNRMDTLPEVIESLKLQKKNLPFELIIINDGSTDSTREYLDTSTFPFPCTIKHTKNKGPASARNVGVTLSKGDIVLLLGDDMIADQYWLYYHQQEHMKTDSANESIILVGLSEWDRRIRKTPFIKYLDETGWQFGYGMIDDPENLSFNYMYASNISLSRKLLSQYRFNESFPYPAWEDTELGLRLVQSGARLKYLPSARTSHMHPTTIKRFCSRHRKSGFTAVSLYRLHPGLDVIPFPGINDLTKPDSAVVNKFKEILAGVLDYCNLDYPGMWETVLRDSYLTGFREALKELNSDLSSPLISLLPLTWMANSPALKHNCGHLQGIVWQCVPQVDLPGHCIFGPHFRIDKDCQLFVNFNLAWDKSDSENSNIATLDVYDSTSDVILNVFQLRSGMHEKINFSLEAKAGQTLEFRIYWHGEVSLSIQSITLDWMS